MRICLGQFFRMPLHAQHKGQPRHLHRFDQSVLRMSHRTQPVPSVAMP